MPSHAIPCDAMRHTRPVVSASRSARAARHTATERLARTQTLLLSAAPTRLPLTTAYTVSRRCGMCKAALQPCHRRAHTSSCVREAARLSYVTSLHATLLACTPSACTTLAGHMTSTCAHCISHRIALAKASQPAQPALIARRSSVQVESRRTASTAPTQRSQHARGPAVSGRGRSVPTSQREGKRGGSERRDGADALCLWMPKSFRETW